MQGTNVSILYLTKQIAKSNMEVTEWPQILLLLVDKTNAKQKFISSQNKFGVLTVNEQTSYTLKSFVVTDQNLEIFEAFVNFQSHWMHFNDSLVKIITSLAEIEREIPYLAVYVKNPPKDTEKKQENKTSSGTLAPVPAKQRTSSKNEDAQPQREIKESKKE